MKRMRKRCQICPFSKSAGLMSASMFCTKIPSKFMFILTVFRILTQEKFEDLTQFKRILDEPGLGDHYVMSKMLALEKKCIFAKFESKVKFT